MMAMMMEGMAAAAMAFGGMGRGSGRGYWGRGAAPPGRSSRGRGRESFTYKRERDEVTDLKDRKKAPANGPMATEANKLENDAAKERAKLIEEKKRRIEELERLAKERA